jgi:multicomponent Na+:H+ antiporter subunit D
MTGLSGLLPVAIILSSAVASTAIFFIRDERSGLRLTLYIGGEVVKLMLVVGLLVGVYLGEEYELRFPLLPQADFVLRADPLAMLFLVLSAGLWLLTTLYSVGYLRGKPRQSRFFGFFGLSVSATAGIALSGNLITLFVFYELLTLATYPLVVHTRTAEAVAVGRRYLMYTLGGGVVLLAGIVALQVLAGELQFAVGGAIPSSLVDESPWALRAIFFLLIAGFGVKTALVPLHSWLPQAMVAPTPVSALLHGVAVVKAGAFGIVRVVYEVFGITETIELGLTLPLSVAASITIVYASARALTQDDLKRRLAFSTVSQVSYIVLGVSIVGFLGTVGGMSHLVHQGIMKVTLFFCAGILAETLGIYKVSQMRGVGRRLPWTMTAFAVASLGMIGLPPMAGFISKWYMGLGAADSGQYWVIAVLLTSTLLNAGYFLPVLYNAFFAEPEPEAQQSWKERKGGRLEADGLMLVSTIIVAAVVLAAGILAGTEVSPLGWARLIAAGEWGYDG